MTPNLRFAFAVLGAGILAIALRIPQLTGPHLIADGDEAILGLMAKHMAAGEGFSFFFMGQRFGIAFVEAAAAALAMKVLGPTVLALKLGVFALWMLGGLFLVLAVRRLGGETAGIVAAILIATCPAWGAFALKARGYYAASFLFAHLGLWLTACLGDAKRDGRSASSVNIELGLLGMVCALLLFSQPIWLLGLLPFVFWAIHKRNCRMDLAALGAGAVLIGAVAGIVLLLQPPAHWKPPGFDNGEGLGAALLLPQRIAGTLAGAFYMREAAGGVFPWIGAIWALALPVAAVRPLLTERNERPLTKSLVSLISIAAVLLFSLANLFHYRYLLPAADFLVVLLALEAGRWIQSGSGRRGAVMAGVALLALAGAAGTMQMRSLVLAWTVEPEVESEREALDALLSELDAAGIGHVYCLNPTLQWTLTFTSGEQVLARWFPPDDRHPPIPQAVDRALFAGDPVAVVGYVDGKEGVERAFQRTHEPPRDPTVIGRRYLLLPDPSPELLDALGFQLNPARSEDSASSPDS